MLDKLRMFIAVAQEEHFGRAAETLGITQPTLSAGIKHLEEQLGVQLIVRGSRYGGLTPEGQAALVWARRIVGDAQQLRDEMRAKRFGLSGQLRIATIPTALTWASRLSADFVESHPRVRVSILSRNSREILAMLENFEAEAGISYLDNEPLGRMLSQPLYVERYMLVCSRRSPFAGRPSVGWHELAGHRLCLLSSDTQNRRIINQNFANAGVSPDPSIESNSLVAVVANVETGDWLTVLPADIARFLSQGRPLGLVPMEAPGQDYTVGLVAPHRAPLTPVLAALLGAARRLSEARG